MDLHLGRVTIVGLGKSGISAALFLYRRGVAVSATDSGRESSVLTGAEELRRLGIPVEWGGHTEKFLKGSDLVVMSPGVPRESLPYRWAFQRAVPVIGEIELASQFFPGRIIAVTGTNGKSTVTTLIGKVLARAGLDVRVGGNLGTPFIELVEGTTPSTWAVIEVSSYQLESIRSFHPSIAILLKVTPHHLERYPDFESYRATKRRIFSNQTGEDWAIVSEGEAGRLEGVSARVRTIPECTHDGTNPNIRAVYEAAQAVCIPRETVDAVLKDFKGLEHRLEFVLERRGIRFFNDSKSTNVASTLWALSQIKERGVWILGGRDKDGDFRELAGPLKVRARGVVAMGEAREKIRMNLEEIGPMVLARELEEAVSCALKLAQEGDAVVLSPACTSFDEFMNFEERGRAFKALVRNGCP
ncbi:MAG: UDP-N-acetylmuramoyl-L-alanine--D-glutamate ligase [Candidatus Omnitrophica bacterium]|nr:UDP-N-acetylmuramoyl-L-alanine--D-glutamate ligase [Candidatus Omnitrophota bacterium]